MIWTICFSVSLGVFIFSILGAIVMAKSEHKRKRILTPFNLMFIGMATSAFVLFIPIYGQIFDKNRPEVLLLSLHNMIRLFIVDGEFTIITDGLIGLPVGFAKMYSLLAAVIFVIAPVLTFGVVLSFFKNISAYKDFWINYFSDVYIFSELNEQALALAASLKKNNRKRLIIFNDVYVNNEETSQEFAERARELGAITFKKDVTVVKYKFHSPKKSLNFFIIGKDDDENVKQTLLLCAAYKEKENVSIYAFSTSANSELLLNKVEKGKIKLRRVNTVQSLISRNLYDDGIKIFQNAAESACEEKLISVVIVGLGQHGTEMAKALAWFCQMDGYRLEMHIYDPGLKAESRFQALCPELMDERYNHDFDTEGEAHYSIHVHSNMDANTKEFWDELNKLETVTYVFTALENDEENIKISVKLRSYFEKREMKPMIDTVVYNSDKKKALKGITNYSNQEYDINFIGDICTSYSEKVVLESDIEALALQRHLKWGKEEEFWKYEYNYRSSIASAIHRQMKIECGIPGADKEAKDRTEQELWALRKLEHRRWNAYMRTEGFTFAEKRNNLAKTHHCLVPFDKLPLKEQEKDDD